MGNIGISLQDTATGLQDAGRADVLVHISPAGNAELQIAIDLLGNALAPAGGAMHATVAMAFPSFDAQTHSAAISQGQERYPWLKMMPYPVPAISSTGAEISASNMPGIHSAGAYMAAIKAARSLDVRACVLLGPELDSLSAHTVQRLAGPILSGRADLVMPTYLLGPFEGLLNTAILYPLTRSLFGKRVRYPLGFDVAISQRMQDQLLPASGRGGLTEGSIVWPATEAAAAGLNIEQVAIEARRITHVEGTDLSSILALILGSLFAQVEAKAVFWQRVRQTQPVAGGGGDAAAETIALQNSAPAPSAMAMIDSFQLGAKNLQEIWGLVLPPNTLLALKKLARTPSAEFRIADSLWVRIVYDFLLAYRLRTISRSHLLGALTPLYLGWVASYVTEAGRDPASVEQRIERLAAAFESDKAYLVARWRWPDRFNP